MQGLRNFANGSRSDNRQGATWSGLVPTVVLVTAFAFIAALVCGAI